MTLLLEDLSFRIGGASILSGLTAHAQAGDIIGLIGPNGSGKSTLANILSGFLPPSSGAVILGGVDVTRVAAPARFARLGVTRSFQSQQLPWNLTVQEAMSAAEDARRRMDGRDTGSARTAFTSARSLLSDIGLNARCNQRVRTLSFGEQRLLTLALALVGSWTVAILDEPFTGLKGEALERVIAAVKKEARGRTVIVIDHTLGAIEPIASRMWFLVGGRLSQFDSFASLVASAAFHEQYMGLRNGDGLARDAVPARVAAKADPPTLSVAHLCAAYGSKEVFRDLSFEVHAGTVVGVLGLNGSGKSTLLSAIAGVVADVSGTVEFDGRMLGGIASDARVRGGLRFLPQSRRLFGGLTVAENVMLAARGAAAANWYSALVGLFGPRHLAGHEMSGVLAGNAGGLGNRLARTLSGGEQARVALARLDLGRPRLLLLDEPTSGMDGLAATMLASKIRDWSLAGHAVVVVEHDLRFVSEVADRVLVLSGEGLNEVDGATARDPVQLMSVLQAVRARA